MSSEKSGLITKVAKHGDTLIILGALASMFLFFDSKFTAHDSRFLEQQKQFNQTIEKIEKVDANARVRDKDLQIAIVKIEN